MKTFCKYCGFEISEKFYFCPNCGKKLKNPPLSTSVKKQIYIYAISILLPPLGLWPAVKYLLDKEPRAKIIGVVAIVLTILSIVITLKITSDFLGAQLQATNQQLQGFQNLGY